MDNAGAIRSQSLLGIGLYSIPEAAFILETSSKKLRRWVEGYYFGSEGRPKRFSDPVLYPEKPELIEKNVLTFLDLIEMRYVSFFRGVGISFPTIRRVAQKGREEFSTNHPFATKRFETDGKIIFATVGEMDIEGVSEDRLLKDVTNGQMVFDTIARTFFKQIEYAGDDVLRLRPLGPDTRIVLDPQRSFGKPIDEKSGVPTFPLFQMIQGGEKKERVAWWYNVEIESVEDAYRFETGLRLAA